MTNIHRNYMEEIDEEEPIISVDQSMSDLSQKGLMSNKYDSNTDIFGE